MISKENYCNSIAIKGQKNKFPFYQLLIKTKKLFHLFLGFFFKIRCGFFYFFIFFTIKNPCFKGVY